MWSKQRPKSLNSSLGSGGVSPTVPTSCPSSSQLHQNVFPFHPLFPSGATNQLPQGVLVLVEYLQLSPRLVHHLLSCIQISSHFILCFLLGPPTSFLQASWFLGCLSNCPHVLSIILSAASKSLPISSSVSIWGHQPASSRRLGSWGVSPTVPTSCSSSCQLHPNLIPFRIYLWFRLGHEPPTSYYFVQPGVLVLYESLFHSHVLSICLAAASKSRRLVLLGRLHFQLKASLVILDAG
ncbi:DNA polymerase delta subunit 3 X2 [Biomphalaria glabrata]|nr:DNA polymerase delta subunit 3 X2 [Biomphalaria glabrata]